MCNFGTFMKGLPLCQIWLIADYTASTASILNLLTLSVDRYWSIISPFSYISTQNKTRAFLTVCGVWFVSLLWIVPIIGKVFFAFFSFLIYLILNVFFIKKRLALLFQSQCQIRAHRQVQHRI